VKKIIFIVVVIGIGFVIVRYCSMVTHSFTFSSSAFSNNSKIPDVYTCSDRNISPPLSWSSGPHGTQSFVLICDDPDAPKGTWVHWVVYNIPPAVTSFPEGASPRLMPQGSLEGVNDFGTPGYGGPCPPQGHGAHRYHFKLYALDIMLDEHPGMTKAQLETLMEGHIRARAEFIGVYERK
jgi:Raf kinase inhibitor-like YbhB/YbcL family protein